MHRAEEKTNLVPSGKTEMSAAQLDAAIAMLESKHRELATLMKAGLVGLRKMQQLQQTFQQVAPTLDAMRQINEALGDASK